ncbi:peptidase inhibitor family I36 protein [Streptomyces zaomyceticus]|uniref:peptidase inhibitor family I36 protein n=1 Tax=Streptomyces zaomyceticus TaxID=68286 RepID=UPI001676DB33|nr:peptidase inhibitor family I36 protein [Streptomyces zaomyceticus]
MNRPGAKCRTQARPSRARAPIAAAASAAALALAALTPATAHAAPTPATAHAARSADCPSGALCLFSGRDFGGDRLPLSSLTGGGTCVSLVDHGWAGRVESAVNTHTTGAVLFPGDDCLGGPYQVAADAGVADLGTFVPLSAWVPGRTA